MSEEMEGGKSGFPVGLAVVFIAALLIGFAIANPGTLGFTQANGCSTISTANSYAPGTSSVATGSGNGVLASAANSNETVQVVDMAVDRYGYSPNSFVLKRGEKVRWVIDAKEITGCNRVLVARDFGINIQLQQGQNVVEFTPDKEGVFRFTCGMGMLQGTFVVVNDTSDQNAVNNALASAPAPKKTGGCGCGG